MYTVKQVWTNLNEDGMYGGIYESLEVLYTFEGEDADVDQGYIIYDESTGLAAEWSGDFYSDYFDALMDLVRNEGGVYIGPDCIAIYDVNEEIVYWQQDEWLEDPSVALSIANAIRMYYEEGPMAIKEAIGRV